MLQISGVRPLLRRPKGWISTPPKPLRSHPGFRLFHTPVIQTRSSGSSRHTGSPGNSLRSLHTFMQKPLSYDSGPLVWIDCEMTGLDPTKDRILEIAVSGYDEGKMRPQHWSENCSLGSHNGWKSWVGTWRWDWVCHKDWEEAFGR